MLFLTVAIYQVFPGGCATAPGAMGSPCRLLFSRIFLENEARLHPLSLQLHLLVLLGRHGGLSFFLVAHLRIFGGRPLLLTITETKNAASSFFSKFLYS